MSERIFDGAIIQEMMQGERLHPQLIKDCAREMLVVVKEGLIRDGYVRIHNFGTFRLKMMAARKGYNPHTRERMMIQARPRVVFVPAKALRERIEPNPPKPLPLPPDEQDTETRSPVAAVAMVVPSENIPHDVAVSGESIDLDADSSSTLVDATSVIAEPSPLEVIEEIHDDEPVASPIVQLDSPPAAISSSELDARDIQATIGEQAPLEPDSQGESDNKHSTLKWVAGFSIVAVALLVTFYLMRDLSNQTIIATEEKSQTDLPVTVSSIPEKQVATIAAPDTPTDTENVSRQQTISLDRPVDVTETEGPFFSTMTYTIVKGDTLWALADRYYLNPFFWPHIYRSNSDYLPNPNLIGINDRLTIPTLEGSPENLTRNDKRSIAEGYFLMYRFLKANSDPDARHALRAVARFDSEVISENQNHIEDIHAEELEPFKGELVRATAHGIPVYQ